MLLDNGLSRAASVWYESLEAPTLRPGNPHALHYELGSAYEALRTKRAPCVTHGVYAATLLSDVGERIKP